MKYFLRQAGFEPAHPEITRLKLVAFTARPLTRNENFHIFIIIAIQKTTKVTFTLHYNYSF